MSKSIEEMATEVTVAWLQAIGNASTTPDPTRLLGIIAPKDVAAAYRTFLDAMCIPQGDPLPNQDAATEVLRNAKVY